MNKAWSFSASVCRTALQLVVTGTWMNPTSAFTEVQVLDQYCVQSKLDLKGLNN